MAATPAVSPLFVKNAIVSLGFNGGAGVQLECHVRRAAIVPTPGDVVTYQPLCTDASYSQAAADTFALELIGVQDWSATGLARLLWDNAGEDVTFSIAAYGAIAANTPAMTGVAKAVRPPYGGTADEWAEFDLELPISGIPVLDSTP
jgi:hypothetical protein